MTTDKVYPEDIECVFEGKSPLGRIYVSNIEAAQNVKTLQRRLEYQIEHGIKAVVTVAKGAFLPHDEVSLPNYLYIPAEDEPEFQLAPYFSKSFDFIDRNLPRTNVLVHCMAGISRSVTVVTAYLMRKFEKPLGETLGQIRLRRCIVNPNQGFMQQLRLFEKELRAQKEASPKTLDRKPRKMSDTTNGYNRSNSALKLAFTSLFGKTSEANPTSDAKQQLLEKESTQPTLKTSLKKFKSESKPELMRHRSQSTFNLTTPSSELTVQPISQAISKKQSVTTPVASPSTTTFKTESLLMAKLGSNEATNTHSRMRELNKYESVRFRNGEDLRSNILRYYKVQRFQ